MFDLIMRLLGVRSRGRSSFRPHASRGVRQPAPGRAPAPQPSRPSTPASTDQIDRPTRRGTTTGLEPAVLDRMPPAISVNAKGAAGLGLFSSGFGAAQVFAGQRGEMGFYKALCHEGLIDSFSSYWSIAMPLARPPLQADPGQSADVDCVIVRGTTVYLLDLKYYASGDVTWHTADGIHLLCRDNASGKQVGNPRKMSQNMKFALQRFSSALPAFDVRAAVVLIPTALGAGMIAPGTAWPGGIPLRNLTDVLAELRAGATAYADATTGAALERLIKN